MTALDHSIPSAPSAHGDERSRRTAELLAAAADVVDDDRRQQLRDEVVAINLRVAHALARRFAGRGVDTDDLEQVACEALVKAVQRFDHSQHHDFLSFAVPTIRGELQRYFRDLGWMVRPTRRVQETQWRAARAEADLVQRLGRSPSDEEMLAELDITAAEYAEAISAKGCFRPTSLERPASQDGDGMGLGELLPGTDAGLPACEARAMVVPLVRELPERDRRVIYLRFFEDRTQNEIGDEIGVGQTQVSRIIDHVLKDLRRKLGDDAPPAA